MKSRKADPLTNPPLAYKDEKFLDSDEARPIRILAEYLEPLRILCREQVHETIVFFGSARLRADGPLGRYYQEARELARLITIWSKSLSSDVHRYVVCSGGGSGIMEAANRGAFDIGAKSVGLNINLPHEQYPNPYITPELCYNFHYFAMRKLHFLLRAKALVTFPGGYGTFDELFEVLTLVQTRKIKPIPVVLVGESYWRRAVDLDFLVEEGVIDQEDRELFWFAETAQEIWHGILRWHEINGEPLIVP